MPFDLARTSSALFDARIRPNRSMSSRWQVLLLGGFAAVALLVGLLFVFAGYWPVSIFLGLDVFLLAFAFAALHRRTRAWERIRIDARDIEITRFEPGHSIYTQVLPASWSRVSVSRSPHWGCQRVALVSRSQSAVVGAALAPEEREALAEALDAALLKVRRGGLLLADAIDRPPLRMPWGGVSP